MHIAYDKIKIYLSICWLLLCSLGCAGLGPDAAGEAAEELTYLVPYDKIQTDKGAIGYVDAEGFLRGITEKKVLAAGRKARDVMSEVALHTPVMRYHIIHYGPRSIDIAGAIKRPGKYDYPVEVDWYLMNLVELAEGFTSQQQHYEYLLIRKVWELPDTFMFLRGEALPNLESIGGDDIMVFPGDIVLFPGAAPLAYIFGAVHTRECFTFSLDAPPTLKNAVEKAKPLIADIHNVKVYRVLRTGHRSIVTLDMDKDPQFLLDAWDVVYVPPKMPSDLPVK